jgi:hypothetical protein
MYERYVKVLAVFFTLTFVVFCLATYQHGEWKDQVEACVQAKEPPPNPNPLFRGVDPNWDPEFECKREIESPEVSSSDMKDLLYFWIGLFLVSAIVRYIRSGRFIT